MNGFGSMFNGFHTHESAASNINASQARTSANNARSAAEAAGHDIERLLMITEALWEIMKEEHGYSDEDLIKRIAMVDMKDGKLDGRVSGEGTGVPACQKCGRPAGKRRQVCIYCGSAIVQQPFDR